jgi:hypothetical protein
MADTLIASTRKWTLALEALFLWAEFFRTDPDPFLEGVRWCFFCGEIEERHKPGCIYLRAQKIVNESRELSE